MTTRTASPARPAMAARAVDANHPIALIQANSLPTLVQRELERMILAGDLAAGEQLREVEVAAMLGVSRGPVREAFRALEESGLVHLEKNRGVYVRQIGIGEADEIYELRAVLDEFVGQRLARSATPAQVRKLRKIVAAMDAAAARDDVDAYVGANIEFHDRLVALAGNAKLLVVYRRLVNELNVFRRTTLARGGTLPVSTREHHEILEHVAGGDAAAAGRAMRDHVMASRARMHEACARDADADARPPAAKRRRAAS
ncbi:MAG TPA: phosphonate utilization associated transcriptional regulator [Casimicrobiaceae bacterium]